MSAHPNIIFGMKPDPYWYQARLTPGAKHWDGDTIRIDIDLGFDTWLTNQAVRLARIDAPERKGQTKHKAMLARDYLLNTVLRGRDFYIKSVQLKGRKRGKYGRWLVDVWVFNNGWVCANDLMVEADHAKYREY